MLTKRAMEVLRQMAEHQHDEEGEIARDGRACYVGYDRISWSVVKQLLEYLLVSDVSFEQVERYVINEIGLAVVRRPELLDEIRIALLKDGAWTIVDDKLVELNNETGF